MSDHGHHDPGGHELEAINTKLLFRLLISLSLVTLLAAAAVVQWFYSQRRELEHRLAAEGSFMLKAHDEEMAKRLDGIDRVAADMATNPALLQAPPAPPGWIHPDDLVGGGAAAPAPAPAPEPEPAQDDAIPVPAPEGDAPEGDAPAEDAPAEDAVPADGAEGDDAKPDKPEADDKKADDKKADDAE